MPRCSSGPWDVYCSCRRTTYQKDREKPLSTSSPYSRTLFEKTNRNRNICLFVSVPHIFSQFHHESILHALLQKCSTKRHGNVPTCQTIESRTSPEQELFSI
jgi:hypothetical protein